MKFIRIQETRKEKNISQEKMAEKLGLYTTTYARYERGEQDIPFYLVIEIAKILEVSIDFLAEIKGIYDEKMPTPKESAIIKAYNEKKDLQKAIDILLGIER